NSEVGSYSESCSHDTLLNQVVNELKELTSKVAEMDSTNNKMIEIMIGLVEIDTLSNVVRPYEHEMHYNKPKNTYKGPTTLVFDTDADDRSVDEISASKFFAGSCSYKRTKEAKNDPTMCVKKLSFPSPSPYSAKRRCDTPMPMGGSTRKSILTSPKLTIGSSKKTPKKL
ncbi:hypothetical protein A2U01_0024143, partial [Trifolium medium]|nr:hypothetical protein [Trifolium medium]